ncbi:MAG: hypothetical protein M2R45_03542 [Verrucomicrobia subdivision 3 bacterium]|nr:hypothetical protein [Limisphaerales bacterium]MCS1416481.1 hypothetical protein [Limisphaerales bacterium]
MPIYMPSDTREVLDKGAAKCASRSLYMDRFTCPQAKDEKPQAKDERRKWFEGLLNRKPVKLKRWNWCEALGEKPIFAQLQSRLMVNMAGGVMENAGLCLDRFGLPFIPGSAVKGCARRMAIQLLREQREDGKINEALITTLKEAALVFGWTQQDWEEKSSDFAYALGEKWGEVSGIVRNHLPDSFAGSVSFLPAHLVDGLASVKLPDSFPKPPEFGKLELDIVTCHHSKYYRGDNKDVATDDEDPNPVVFPAVAAGHVFAFHVMPLRNGGTQLTEQARAWLRKGLSLFGLGAKTNAGYGWFDCSDELQETVRETLDKQKEIKEIHDRKIEEAKKAAEKKKQEEEKRRKEKNILASMTDEERIDYELEQKTDEQFRSLLDNFLKQKDETQKAIVRALRKNPSSEGSRRKLWEVLKERAKKGKRAQIVNEIRQLSKRMYPGREGKMP